MAFDIEVEFLVDAYTAAVQVEFEADFSVDSYTAQVEAKCLKPSLTRLSIEKVLPMEFVPQL